MKEGGAGWLKYTYPTDVQDMVATTSAEDHLLSSAGARKSLWRRVLAAVFLVGHVFMGASILSLICCKTYLSILSRIHKTLGCLSPGYTPLLAAKILKRILMRVYAAMAGVVGRMTSLAGPIAGRVTSVAGAIASWVDLVSKLGRMLLDAYRYWKSGTFHL
jgi:hypothetical protein